MALALESVPRRFVPVPRRRKLAPGDTSRPRTFGGPQRRLTQEHYDQVLATFRRLGRTFNGVATACGMAEKTVKRLWFEGMTSGTGPRRKVWESAPPIKGVIEAESEAKIRAGRLSDERILKEAAEKEAKALAVKEREAQEEELLKLSRATIRSGLVAGVKAAPILHAMVGWAKNEYCEIDADGGLRIKKDADLKLKDITLMIDKFGLLATRMTVAADTIRKLGITERSEKDEEIEAAQAGAELSDEELEEQLGELGKWYSRRAERLGAKEGGKGSASDGASPAHSPAAPAAH